ncbi:Golgin subfamily A member 7 [Thelohanellus kitauei]|uniref:Ras modification protein ERF4 n=1 Tax=Thelohanellus kitauei TaxID=669202 RepID=A0A0C2MI35_THEKT|nr:Golgin subfamily A member 7 [Thelohanellus kitauei]
MKDRCVNKGLYCPTPKEKLACFVERDYSKGMEVQFSLEFPKALTNRLSKEDFENAIIRVNHVFVVAERINFSTIIESIFSFFVCYLNLIFFQSSYERQMKSLDKLIMQLNREIFFPKNLKIYHPIHRGLRLIMITDLTDCSE